MEVFDRVRVATTTVGINDLVLGAADPRHQTFPEAGAADGTTLAYVIDDGPNWEVNYGVLGNGGTTLTRNVIQSSAGGTTKIILSGNARVYSSLNRQFFADIMTAIGTKEPGLVAGTALQYYRGDKTWQTLNKAAVGLGNVDNTADSAKAVLSASKLTTARTINGVSFDGSANITINAVDSTARIASSEKGAANGVATLDAGGTIPMAQMPSAVLGAMSYQGTWNASTNSPAIPAAAAGNKGYFYKVATAGTTNVSGITDWQIGDWIVSNGTSWDKIDNTDQVVSVAGLSGAISAASLRTALSINNVDNTSDANKPVSTAQQTALNGKADLAGALYTGSVQVLTPNQLALKASSASNPTVIHRNDGSTYYFLLSDASTGNPNFTWNSLRPLSINTTTGRISSANGQSFSGGMDVANGLTVSGGMTVNGAAAFNNTLNFVGGTVTGHLALTGGSSMGNNGIAAGSNAGELEIQGNGTGAAAMTFHRPGSYAVYFGLDTNNKLSVGGWSIGAVSYAIYHEGNKPTLSQLSNDSGFITTNGRAYPRKSDGGDLNMNWSGQSGQPSWLWGGSDGTNMYVYNPSNFYVAGLQGSNVGSAPHYAARAWVNFNGSGVVSIRSSGNVSSVTDNGVGRYTVNFSTAMPDANYTATGSATEDVTGQVNMRRGTHVTFRDWFTTSIKVYPIDVTTSDNFVDSVIINVVIVR